MNLVIFMLVLWFKKSNLKLDNRMDKNGKIEHVMKLNSCFGNSNICEIRQTNRKKANSSDSISQNI